MILHITNDYSGSTVYMNLIKELDKRGLTQVIYNPIRDQGRIGNNKIEFLQNDSKIIYDYILNKYGDRIFYRYKIAKIVKNIEAKIDLSQVKLIHAHTWYSDGGVAYLLSKRYNIPYIVAVRSTDMAFFFRYQIFSREFGRKILFSAANIIHISKAYYDRFVNLLKSSVIDRIKDKIKVVPNGIDDFWLNNMCQKKENDGKLSLIYVGSFVSRKNVKLIQKSVIFLNQKLGVNVFLNVVGDGGSDKKEVVEVCQQFPQYFKYHGAVRDKGHLLSLYRQCLFFIMPSINETFGLVYIEALSQGLPIIYTANDGIDGFYGAEIGERVEKPLSVGKLVQAILVLLDDYEKYEIDKNILITNHKWRNISKRYTGLYNRVLKSSQFSR